MEPIVIKLTVPLTHGAETITELRITRRPTAGDLRGVKISELTFDDAWWPCRPACSTLWTCPISPSSPALSALFSGVASRLG